MRNRRIAPTGCGFCLYYLYSLIRANKRIEVTLIKINIILGLIFVERILLYYRRYDKTFLCQFDPDQLNERLVKL